MQGANWDPAVGSSTWDRFCERIGAGGAGVQLGVVRVPAEVVNYAAWIRDNVVPLCPKGMTVEEVSVAHRG